jgi:DNA polymerase-3 subunit beta
MAFDIGTVTPFTIGERPLVATTLAGALSAYDAARAGSNEFTFEDAAHALAALLRKPKAAKAPADAPGTFTAGNFAAALKTIRGVIERRATIPILSNVRLAASAGRLSLSGSNLDAEVTVHLTGYHGPEFDLTVPASSLAGMLKGAKSVTMDAPADDPRFRVTVNGATTMLPMLPSEDFPVMSSAGFKATTLMHGGDLRDALGFLAPYISAEETRYYLNGVYMHSTIEGSVNKLTFAATDGSRMAVQKMPAPEWDGNLAGVILPRKTVELLLKTLPDAEVMVEVGEAKIRFTYADGTTYTSKVIDGNFPDYTRVIPRADAYTAPTVMTVHDAKAFRDEVSRIASISSERSRSVRLTLAGEVEACVRNMEAAQVTGVLPGASSAGEPREISFNATYLMAIFTDAGTMSMGGSNDPALVQFADRPDRLAVLMPLRA